MIGFGYCSFMWDMIEIQEDLQAQEREEKFTHLFKNANWDLLYQEINKLNTLQRRIFHNLALEMKVTPQQAFDALVFVRWDFREAYKLLRSEGVRPRRSSMTWGHKLIQLLDGEDLNKKPMAELALSADGTLIPCAQFSAIVRHIQEQIDADDEIIIEFANQTINKEEEDQPYFTFKVARALLQAGYRRL